DNVLDVSTPLCAPLNILLDSYNKAYDDNLLFTDDIAVIENYHKDIKINLIKSNDEDIKLTTKMDYYLLNLLLEIK
nr:2-C-methyl-D-erythritol 4-phosphate cytidylyltransferase [Acholeplasmatales bacterium]